MRSQVEKRIRELAGGPGATLSHSSAAVLTRLRSRSDVRGPIHVSVPGRGGGRRPGILFHRVDLSADECRVIDGIPVTSPGRTLVDIAGMLDAARIPRPHSNVPIGPYELDHFWPVEGVAIEIDSRAHHSSRGRFEGDRRKDAWLKARGIEVIRLTWRQITREAVPTAVQSARIPRRIRMPALASPDIARYCSSAMVWAVRSRPHPAPLPGR